MATTETATDQAAIASVVQLYFDGVSKGDAAKLTEAFHEQAWMYGLLAGQRYDVPVAQLAEMVTSHPLDIGDGSFSSRIASIEQVGDVALATVEEDGCWGSVSFVDFLSLAKIDGEWKIVNKTFTHTGGEMPSG